MRIQFDLCLQKYLQDIIIIIILVELGKRSSYLGDLTNTVEASERTHNGWSRETPSQMIMTTNAGRPGRLEILIFSCNLLARLGFVSSHSFCCKQGLPSVFCRRLMSSIELHSSRKNLSHTRGFLFFIRSSLAQSSSVSLFQEPAALSFAKHSLAFLLSLAAFENSSSIQDRSLAESTFEAETGFLEAQKRSLNN